MRIRSSLYRTARWMGDLNAVYRGPAAFGRRLIRKSLWRSFAQAMRKLVP